MDRKIKQKGNKSTMNFGLELYCIGSGDKVIVISVVEIGSKMGISNSCLKDILGHIKSNDDGIVFLPSELKSEGEPASNLRSGDIRKLSTGKNTEENSLIMDNIKYIFNETSFKYIQTALPREGRPISIDIKKLCDFKLCDFKLCDLELNNFIDLKQYNLDNKKEYEMKISESIFKFMNKYDMMDKGKLLKATKGAYNKTMLADVFSFIEGVLILKGKEKTITETCIGL